MTALKHADLIYDVGMHKGEDAEFYLRKGFRVVAFEANPELVRACRDRFAEFIDRGRLTIIEGAIVSRDVITSGAKKVAFYRNNNVSAWGTVRTAWADRNAELGTSSSRVEVDVIDFASVIREQGMPHFMKVDIEGCDLICIETLKEFSERPDYVSFESDKTSFGNIRREIDVLASLGYDGFQAVEQSEIPRSQVPPFPPREGAYVDHRFEEGSSGLFGLELATTWKGRREILRQYRAVRLGYLLLGDRGIMMKWKFRGSWRLQSWARALVRRFTVATVPGWYDTHARHSTAGG